MSAAARIVSWVVYQMPIHKKLGRLIAVCEESEWNAMELAKPGYYTLIKADIMNEGEAEKLARSEQSAVVTSPALPKIARL